MSSYDSYFVLSRAERYLVICLLISFYSTPIFLFSIFSFTFSIFTTPSSLILSHSSLLFHPFSSLTSSLFSFPFPLSFLTALLSPFTLPLLFPFSTLPLPPPFYSFTLNSPSLLKNSVSHAA